MPFTFIILSSGLNNLLAFLNGSCTFNTFSTPSKVKILSESILEESPTNPKIQYVPPLDTLTSTPYFSKLLFTKLIVSSLTVGLITTIIYLPPTTSIL